MKSVKHICLVVFVYYLWVMLDTINIIKGVHPGIILDRELKKTGSSS